MNKSSKTKDGANIINLDKYKLIGTHWIALYVNGVNMTFFDSFGAEYIQKEITKFIGKKYHNRCLQNKSKWSNNVCILLYLIYLLYDKK